MKKILFIVGPTATGKTACALSLAKSHNGALISADSRQVYKGMDIGTGKDIPAGASFVLDHTEKIAGTLCDVGYYLIEGVPVWLYDVVKPSDAFSVSHYQTLARSVITRLQGQGKLPIVVGGTGLYVKSLLTPIETAHIPPNKQLRGELAGRAVAELQQRLQSEDSKGFAGLNDSDRQNPRRLIRKIEIAVSSGMRAASPPLEKDQDPYLIGLGAPNDYLYQAIDRRVDARIDAGIEQEVDALLAQGYTWEMPALNTFGYKEWRIEGDREARRRRWKFDEHAYARRQNTWFRAMLNVHWYDITQGDWRDQVNTAVHTWYTEKKNEHSS